MHSTPRLPARPHLGQLRKQAKELAKARQIRLSAAQLAVARSYGFASWPRLKLFVEASAQSFEQKLARFLAAACSDRLYQAKQLLALEPRLARHSIVTAAVCGDAEHVETLLAQAPALARSSGALGHLAFSRFHRDGAAAGILAAARALLAAGADANERYRFPGAGIGEDPMVSALYGAAADADHPALAALLLAAGADPNDREAVYHATELPGHETLRLLLAHGAAVAGTGALKRKLDFDDPAGVELLLAHGADPDEEGASPGTALHHAIRRGRSAEVIELLLARGASLAARDADGLTPYRLALRYGDQTVIARLAARGGADFPSTPGDLGAAERAVLSELAQRGDLAAVVSRVEAGAAVEAAGAWGGTALHHAAFHGADAVVAYLIGRGAALETLNDYGGTALGAALYGSATCRNAVGDYALVVESLLEAGAKILPHHHGMGSEEVDEVLKGFEG